MPVPRPSKPRIAPERWWQHPFRGCVWALASHPDHDALLVGGAPDRVVAALPDAGYRTSLTVERAGAFALVNSSQAMHLVDLRGGEATGSEVRPRCWGR